MTALSGGQMRSTEYSEGKSNVLTLVQQLKAGKMSKDDVLEQLRRIQHEKRAFSIKGPVSSQYSESVPSYDDTALGQSTTMMSLGTAAANAQDCFSSDSKPPKELNIGSWVAEETSLLAEEEEVFSCRRPIPQF